MKPTIGLAIITNNVKETERLVETYEQYFDKLYITVASRTKQVHTQLKAKYSKNGKVELSYFKWVDHFGKARLFNQSQIKTDYWFWMDVDDEIINPQNIKLILNYAVTNAVDALFLNYDYFQNEMGEQQANHWRERLIRNDSLLKWADVPCHETVLAEGSHSERSDLVSIKHHKDINQMLSSMQRNKVLLEKDWKINKDPRTALYLGTTYEYEKQFDEAIQMYAYLIEHGGWEEQKVVAWNHIADCHYFKGDFEKALVATNMAIHLDPTHPDAYYQKILIYTAGEQLDKACEWAEVAMTKKPKEQSMQLVDPTRYEYKGIFLAAQANLFLGRIQRAWELYQQVIKIAPHFIQEVNRETGTDWIKTFEEAFHDHKAIDYIHYLTKYEQQYGGNPTKLFDSLPSRLSHDVRLNADRVVAYPPKKWPEKSVAIFCGQGFEPWGPDVLDKGMGGSEEAIVYLSRELSKLGWSITVFCERDSEYTDTALKPIQGALVSKRITYKPWTEFNPWDEFDVLVAWRQPTNIRDTKARVKIVDLHDTIPEGALKIVEDEATKFMVKSPYHRSLYPSIPDDKFIVVGNAIVKEHFNV